MLFNKCGPNYHKKNLEKEENMSLHSLASHHNGYWFISHLDDVKNIQQGQVYSLARSGGS